jgi:hypothetical protein
MARPPALRTAPARTLLAAALIAAVPAPARAEVEVWSQFETEVLLEPRTGLAPAKLGFVTDVRFNGDRPGLERVQLRWGPRWDLPGPFTLGLNHTAYLQQPEPGVYVQEQRAELEPQVRGELGPLTWRDRSRLELRWRPDALRWRYRNQLRVEGEIAPGWQPFVSDEVFVDLAGPTWNENRITLGLSREVAGAGWECGYTLRTRHGGAAAGPPDHLITLNWFNALKRPPLLSEADPDAVAALRR